MTEEEKKKGDKPDYRIVQPGKDKDGKDTFTSVGAIWKAPKPTPTGKTMYNLKIGNLRLLMFPNDK